VVAEDIRGEVRAAAEGLVGDLRSAEGSTRGWLEEELADLLVEAALGRCLGRLAATGCSGKANRLPSGELWRTAGPLLEAGSLQLRARMKPRGYAGDYELLAAICEETACEDPLGRAFDRFFLRQAAPQAVRSRTRAAAAALVEQRLRRPGPFRVVHVGSGPAIDVELALRALPSAAREGLSVTLLDVDPEALDHARARLGPLLDAEALQFRRTNVARLSRAKNPNDILPPADMLLCPGLFDYLDDAAAAEMLRLLWTRLAPGGTLLLGNFAPHNPTRPYMEWIGNWYLIYRTAEDLTRLATEAGIPAAQARVGEESIGIDLFLVGSR